MNWKHSFRSIYYDGTPEPADLDLQLAEIAFLMIDHDQASHRRERRAYFCDCWGIGPKVHALG